MDFITNQIWQSIMKNINNMLSAVIEQMLVPIISLSHIDDINKLIDNLDLKIILTSIQILCCIFLVYKVSFRIFKATLDSEGNIYTITKKTITSASLIVLLPLLFSKIIIPVGNLLVEFIGKIPVLSVDLKNPKPITIFLELKNFVNLLPLFLIAYLVIIIIFCILAGIRYVELIIAYLISPFVAIKCMDDDGVLKVWFAEVTSLIFCNVFHIFIIIMNMKLMINFGSDGSDFKILLIIFGFWIVGIKGSTMIKKYIYNSGLGRGIVNTTTTMTSMAASRYIITGNNGYKRSPKMSKSGEISE